MDKELIEMALARRAAEQDLWDITHELTEKLVKYGDPHLFSINWRRVYRIAEDSKR